MKKLTVVASVAIAAAVMSSCGNSTPKANLKNEVDTLSYAMGLAQTQGMREYMMYRMGVDTTYVDEFIKGVKQGVSDGDDKKKAAYYAGVQIGQQISTQMVEGLNRELFGDDTTQTISLKNFMAGFISGYTRKGGLMTVEQASQVAQLKMESIRSRTLEKVYGPNKEKGEKFLAANAKKPGVKTLEGGVQYKVLKEGKGELPADTSMVKVHYEGRTLEGKVFDSSYKRNRPLELRCNQTIKGWSEALTHMPVGSTWEIYVPQELAYGSHGQGDIKPFSALIFKVELISIVK